MLQVTSFCQTYFIVLYTRLVTHSTIFISCIWIAVTSAKVTLQHLLAPNPTLCAQLL